MTRPDVDIVIPFHGPQQALEELRKLSSEISLAAGDSLTIIDNRPTAAVSTGGRPQVIAAPEVQSSYHARNCGAAGGRGEWILFLDADVIPPPDLLDRYFAREPAAGTAVLAGGVADEPPELTGGSSAAVAYAHGRSHMSQQNTLLEGRWRYAQTANCMVRRTAFDAVGGFAGDIRSGGDADLCFRLIDAGWGIEARPEAAVIHRARLSVRALLAQRARHGAGAAWVNRRHPGSFARRRWSALALWSLGRAGAALSDLARGRRESAAVAAIEPLDVWAFELGRLTCNHARRDSRRAASL